MCIFILTTTNHARSVSEYIICYKIVCVLPTWHKVLTLELQGSRTLFNCWIPTFGWLPNTQSFNRASTSPLHLRQEEKILASIHREGDVDQFEVRGLLCLHVTDQELATVQINVDNNDERQIQIQVSVLSRQIAFWRLVQHRNHSEKNLERLNILETTNASYADDD